MYRTESSKERQNVFNTSYFNSTISIYSNRKMKIIKWRLFLLFLHAIEVDTSFCWNIEFFGKKYSHSGTEPQND